MAFPKHINAAVDNIISTKVDLHNNKLAFMDCAISPHGGSLEDEVYGKRTCTNQYPLFDSRHPVEHELAGVRTLHH